MLGVRKLARHHNKAQQNLHNSGPMHRKEMKRAVTNHKDRKRRPRAEIVGYSIGRRWIDGNGRYDVLEVETHGPFKGPRAYDASGLPLHFDNQSIFKERLRRNKDDPNIFSLDRRLSRE
jgi:hypothetical protein